MNRTLMILIATSTLACGGPDPVRVGSMCPADVVREVNDRWIADHDDPGDNKWARAVYFTGNMAAYELLGVPEYLAYAIEWADDHGWGIEGGVETRNADDHTAGQTYLALYAIDPAPFRIADITASIDRVVGDPVREDWWWIDALFMAAPVYAALGEVTGDPAYHEAMFDLYIDTRHNRGLYDPDARLWYRDESYLYPEVQTPAGHKVFWSRGNGWVMAALVRTLEHLPSDSPYRDEYETMLADMAAAVAALQRPDGFWSVSLHDPDHYPGPETSGTALFTYAIAWGIDHGVLDRARYEPVVYAAWTGMVRDAIHESGRLGFVQGVGEAPSSSQPVDFDDDEDFGVGAFLLAGSEVARLDLALGCESQSDTSGTNFVLQSVTQPLGR